MSSGSFILFKHMLCIHDFRQAKSGYPAPLAIPLPSYSVDPTAPSPGPPNMHRATVGILQHSNMLGDPRRQSQKSLKHLSQINNDSHMNYFEHHHPNQMGHGVGSPIDVLTSEETSDTNIEDHLEGGGSSDPASYDDIIHHRRHSTSRSKARSSSTTRNGDLKRSSTPRSSSKQKQHGNDIRSSCKRHGDSSKKEGQHQSMSRDSGIDERRESLSLTCSNCHQSTGGSSW